MPDLIASPALDAAPVILAGVTLASLDTGPITRLTIRRGHQADGAEALNSAHGMGFPAANRATGREGARALWAGPGQALLIGPEPDPRLAQSFTLVDQTDAYAGLTLEGLAARDILARLTPLDLREAGFRRGFSMLSLLGHIPLSLTRTTAQRFLLLVPRSMASSAFHDLAEAARLYAARLDSAR